MQILTADEDVLQSQATLLAKQTTTELSSSGLILTGLACAEMKGKGKLTFKSYGNASSKLAGHLPALFCAA